MTETGHAALPAAVRPLFAFCRILHDNGFSVTGDRTVSFLKAITLLGPRDIGDLYWAARATLAPEYERIGLFDSLFNAAFREDFGTVPTAKSISGEETVVADSASSTLEPIVADRSAESGATASATELLSVKSFAGRQDNDRLAAMRRRLHRHAPVRRDHRCEPVASGRMLDLRRTLARMIRGGVLDTVPAWRQRRKRTRRILILVDISGSMKDHTEDYLRFAHTLTHALPAVETFSFGTRLTRLTNGLRHKDQARVFKQIAAIVADWDGGTRIADSINGFLHVPHYARLSRGALVVVLSDGLERGDVGEMVQAVRRLASRSWRLAWLTPLAGDPEFRPETAALSAILPIVDHLGDGSSIGTLCDFIERSARLGLRLPAPGRMGGTVHGNTRHRRASPHLATGRPTVADGPHGAAHLRTL